MRHTRLVPADEGGGAHADSSRRRAARPTLLRSSCREPCRQQRPAFAPTGHRPRFAHALQTVPPEAPLRQVSSALRELIHLRALLHPPWASLLVGPISSLSRVMSDRWTAQLDGTTGGQQAARWGGATALTPCIEGGAACALRMPEPRVSSTLLSPPTCFLHVRKVVPTRACHPARAHADANEGFVSQSVSFCTYL